MKGYCSQCEAPVPVGQSICSMCMGDIDHGKDNHYRDWAEHQRQEEQEEQP